MGSNPFSSYQEYMQSETWQYKRDTIITIRKKCQICSSKKRLCVHHLHYKNLGMESAKDLLCVCFECHNDIHKNNLKGSLGRFNFDNTKEGVSLW